MVAILVSVSYYKDYLHGSRMRVYAKIEHVVFQKIEYAYNTFRTAILNENSVSYTNVSDIGHIGIIMHAHHYLSVLEC